MQNYGEDYANLLIWQYRDKPKIRKLIAEPINAINLFDCLEEIREAFNVKTAIGLQLRRIGTFLGLPNVAELNSLDDNSYRSLVSLKIILNRSNGSVASIVDGLFEIFNTQISVVNNYNMNIFYFCNFTTSLVRLAVKYDLLPRPLGVGVTVIEFETQAVKFTSSSNTNASYGIDKIGSNGLGSLYSTKRID
jgi:hypothetical protein